MLILSAFGKHIEMFYFHDRSDCHIVMTGQLLGHDPGQEALVDSACENGWTKLCPEVTSNHNHSVILWFCYLLLMRNKNLKILKCILF